MTRTVLLAVLLLASVAAAEVRLHGLFRDHMVLQRGQRFAVWGWASPGEKVTVSFKGASTGATADKSGRWRVVLGPFEAARGLTLTVNSITLEDVCVGDVWVCSGQSNMQWAVRASKDAAKEIAAANDEGLRFFSVPRRVAGEPTANLVGSWKVCNPKSVATFSAVAYYFGRELRRDDDVPVGLVHASWGGTPAEAWTRRPVLVAHDVLKPIVARWDLAIAAWPRARKDWEAARAKAKAEGKRGPRAPLGPNHPHRASGLWNGMIAPLIPYTIRGVIWYQGESNAARAEQYRTLFPAMIRDWRAAWNQGDFPFLFVQLANFRAAQTEPGDSAWAELRDAQRLALREPNTGMAVAIDIGEARDIHPKNKQEVGRRLALALKGKMGPRLVSAAFTSGRAVLTFDGPLRARGGDPLVGFAIAGEDKTFRWAQARIEGKTVIVRHPAIKKPVAVRYAWADNPRCTLIGEHGLPASPFRTDDWPGSTVAAR